MVYRGKPSKACLPCRRRKLLCDLKPESCGQCRRASLHCTGYRDTESLQIRDESATVRRKAEQSRPQSVRSLDLSLCHQAKDVFYHNYVVGDTKGYTFLQPYYSSLDQLHLVASLDAVALAYLNYQKHSPTARDESQKKYVTALRLTNSALKTTSLATKDSTLLAVLLLDLYEKINSTEPMHDGSWSHIQGAMSLVKMRGEQQYRDPAGISILIRLSTNLLISCVASDKEPPAELEELRTSVAEHFLEPSSPKWRETGLMIGYARLKHRIKAGTIAAAEIVATATELDVQFLQLTNEVVASWQYISVPVEDKSAHHFESKHHQYPDEHIAQMWNVLRITRILLNGLVCEYGGDETSANQATIQRMGADISASVPQYIGDSAPSSVATPPEKEPHANRPPRARETEATQHLPCYRLIFPLYIAAQSLWAAPEMKAFAIGRLKFMAEFHAIANAATVARILESEEKNDPWHVYALLGSYAFVC